jgi:hypothetical protein
LFIFSFASFAGLKSERPAKTSETRKSGEGELQFIEGIPFLKLSGNHYEMGVQYGVLLKDKLQKIHGELLPYRDLWLQKLPGDIHERLEKLTDTKIIQQLKGMAEGSGLPYSDLLLGAYFGVLERGGCSSILVKIKNETSYRLIHGRNFDYGKGTGRYPVVIEYNPTHGIKHLVIGTIGSAGLAEGMNEKGITVSENLAPGDLKNSGIQNTSTNIKLREILSSVSSLKDVEMLMEGYASDVGNTFTIGSGFEIDGIIYDLNYDNGQKNYFGKKNWLYATNGFVSEELNRIRDDPRSRIILTYLESGRLNSVDDMIELLSDPGTTFGVNNPSTIHAVVFDAKRMCVFMAFYPKFAAWNFWLKFDWGRDVVTVYKEAEVEKLKNTDTVELTEVHITAAYWSGNLPMRGAEQKNNDPHFWLLIEEWLKEKGGEQLYEFSAKAARELTLRAEGQSDVKAIITKGTIATEHLKGFMFKIVEEDLPKMVPGIPYTIHIDNVSAIYKWIIEEGVTVTRPGDKKVPTAKNTLS